MGTETENPTMRFLIRNAVSYNKTGFSCQRDSLSKRTVIKMHDAASRPDRAMVPLIFVKMLADTARKGALGRHVFAIDKYCLIKYMRSDTASHFIR
jgi:hypothetical protein